MSHTIANLLPRIATDPWRTHTPFSPQVVDANRAIFDSGEDHSRIREALNAWLEKNQPCLFGRLAAKQDLLRYCILTESDLAKSDAEICERIQAARTQWTQEGYDGRRSGFVIFAASPTLANALPDGTLCMLAKRLCELYLVEQPVIEVDRIYHDEIFLERPGAERMTWKWLAGVNYFCANADGRWWQDHRIPGGLAISVNSVGHLAKSGAIARELQRLRGSGSSGESFPGRPVISLQTALVWAMKTIALATETVSGRATELMPLCNEEDDGLPIPKCPFELSPELAGKDFRYYLGHYHTDYTLPGEYFLPAVKRPSQCKAHTLEFTYLIDSAWSNPDAGTMGAGRRIRGDSKKQLRLEPTIERIADHARLLRALSHWG
jgi:hypothetical protein